MSSLSDYDSSIKNMKLYNHFERVDNELKAAGHKDGSPLKPDDLYAYDHMNYYGTAAVQNAIDTCKIISDSKVLDVGSGLGGPARYMASKTGCHVLAIEIQPDCSEKAKEYTERCNLSENISHSCLNVITCDMDSLKIQINDNSFNTFDMITSWLVFLHIPEKTQLFLRLATVCSPGGHIYCEDFYQKNPFTEKESKSLKEDVYCAELTDKDTYMSQLEKAGFEVVSFEDVTDSWTEFVQTRRENYIANRDRTLQVHGEATYDSQLYFFEAIKTLFTGGNLGGVRYIAKKR